MKKALLIILKVFPWVLLVITIKWFIHHAGYEIISLIPVFTALLGATVFLMGFMISGVLSDYKESEKLPGELASILLTMADEADYILLKTNDRQFVGDRLKEIYSVGTGIRSWFYRETKTKELFTMVDRLTDSFFLMEKFSLPNYIARLKQEQNNLRKILIRVHTIRETNFVFTGYFLANTVTVLLIIGLIFLKVEPFYESLFFIGLITYLLIFLLRLIKDLDNPFGYSEKYSFEDVSLKPVEDAIEKIHQKIIDLEGK